MKIINVSDKPYEWTFDSCNYGPLNPGEILDLSYENAVHAVKRSFIMDDEGMPMGQRVQFLDSVDKSLVSEIVTYICPMVHSGQCNAKPFPSMDALRAHIDGHLRKPVADIPTGQPLPKPVGPGLTPPPSPAGSGAQKK